MIIQELRHETWRFIENVSSNQHFLSEPLEAAKRLYKRSLRDLGYSEAYINENCKRIEQLMQHKSDSVQAPLLHLQEKEVNVWLIETLKKRLQNYLMEDKNLDLPSALYIVSHFISLNGREMIQKFAKPEPQIA
jgi:hypothetical protein